MKPRKIQTKEPYWVLLCDCSEPDPMICGVYPSKKEAEEANKKAKECPAEHSICRTKKLMIEI